VSKQRTSMPNGVREHPLDITDLDAGMQAMLCTTRAVEGHKQGTDFHEQYVSCVKSRVMRKNNVPRSSVPGRQNSTCAHTCLLWHPVGVNDQQQQIDENVGCTDLTAQLLTLRVIGTRCARTLRSHTNRRMA
jgi:hypothetical protein